MKVVVLVLAIVCVWCGAAVAQQAVLPGWLTASTTLENLGAATPAVCPAGTSYIPIVSPRTGLSYECRPNLDTGRDVWADRLTEINAGLVVMDATLTGYLVWNKIGQEGNPLMKPFFDADKPWRVGIKGALGAVQMIGIYRVTKPKTKVRYITLATAIVINGYACLNNYLIYRDHQRDQR